MTETNNTPPAAHDCAEEIAREMYAVEKANKTHPEIWRNWDDFPKDEKSARKAAVQALPGILLTHAGDDLKDFLTVQIGTSSPWRSLLGYISAAAVGAAALWGASFFISCAPVTPGQVRQIDTAHAIMHRVTDTDCTLCVPVTLTPSK